MDKLHEFENLIDYHFQNIDLLKTALTHSSYVNESKEDNCEDNERLEFFGDAILELFISNYLFEKFKKSREGDLTKLRASMVCESSLAVCAKKIRLGEFLYMGKGEEASGGRNRNSITSDAFEALVAAIYLDSGEQSSDAFLRAHFLQPLEHESLFYDAKTRLQEIIQKIDGASLHYELIGEEGPSHAKIFEVAVYCNEQLLGTGKGKSKKAAQQNAAHFAIKKLEQN